MVVTITSLLLSACGEGNAEPTPAGAFSVIYPPTPTSPITSASATPPPTALPTIPLPTATITPLPMPTPTTVVTDVSELLGQVLPPTPPIELPPNTMNVALLGVDTRPGRGGAATDVVMIASINPDVPVVTLLSFPRDTLVYMPGRSWGKINTAFAYGGPELFKETIKHNFGIHVDHYAIVNFAGVVNAVNTLGSIDVVVTCPLYHVFPKDPYFVADPASPLTVTTPYQDSFTGEVWQPGQAVPTLTIDLPQAGVYTLNGLQTLAYARARQGIPNGDIDRGRREQKVVRALFNKAKQADVLTQIPALFAQFQRDVNTDLSLDNLVYLAGLADNLNDVLIRSRYIDAAGLKQMTLPSVGYVLVPNRETLLPYLQQALMVSLNQRANDDISIEVWNGTGLSGFGAASADRLAELGFRVVNITDADQYYPYTQVINFETTSKGSAIPLLQRTFSIADASIIPQPTDNQDPNAPRYRVIVGSDFNPCYLPGNTYFRWEPQAPASTTTPTPDPNAPTPDPNQTLPPDLNPQQTPEPTVEPSVDPNQQPAPATSP